MDTRIERPPAFRDGKQSHQCLLDLLMSEVAAELARRRAPLRDHPSPVLAAHLDTAQDICLTIVTFPAVRTRLQRLEATVSKWWLDPTGFVSAPISGQENPERRSVAFRGPSVGRVAANDRERLQSAFGGARFTAEDVTTLVPAIPTPPAGGAGIKSLPVGTMIGGQWDADGLGRFDIDCFVEVTP